MAEEVAKVTRRRAHLTMTVHPDTLVRLDLAASKFALPRGQIVDKLVHALGTCIEQQTMTCVTGEVCRVGRRDVPAVL